MSKKNFWKFLAVVVILAVAAAGCIIYFSKYKNFRKSLDEDFNDFEADTAGSDTPSEPAIKREYVSIPLDKPKKNES